MTPNEPLEEDVTDSPDDAAAWRAILGGQVIIHDDCPGDVECSCHPTWVEWPGEA